MGKKRRLLDDANPGPPTSRRRAEAPSSPLGPHERAQRRTRVKIPEEVPDDEEISTEDEWQEDDDDAMEAPRKRRARTRDNVVVNAEEDRTCPHCHKLLSSTLGYQYHVDHFVCRPQERPGGPVVQGRRRKSSADAVATEAKQYPRIRGKQVADRTCPQCQRVFTSVHGMHYHRDKRVCQVKPSDATTAPYATLAAGQCFLLPPYGMVQVVRDDRATPVSTATQDSDAAAQRKRYASAVAKRAARQQQQWVQAAVRSRARRLLLQEAYLRSHDGRMEAKEIQRIYAACDRVPVTTAPSPPALEDPAAPPDAHPDRIVEGRLVPDPRPRSMGPRRSVDAADPTDAATTEFTLLPAITAPAIPIFLPRRALTTPYTTAAARYDCPHCGQSFASKPGYKYHWEKGPFCRGSKNDDQQNLAMDARARQFVAHYHIQRAALTAAAAMPTTTEVAPPAVRTAATTVPTTATQVPKPPAAVPPPDAADDEEDPTSAVSPDVVLARLSDELYRYQGSLLGPMYTSVWKALGYRAPPKKAKSRAPRAPAAPTERAVVPLPMVDLGPLVQEVDAGRYPSMPRFRGARAEACAICQHDTDAAGVEQDALWPCMLCPQVEHWTCACTKFLIKFPEAGEDFLCHNCIGIIAARRSRAEKRRLEKLSAANTEDEGASSASLPDQWYSSTDPARLKELHLLTTGVVRDREFECVAAQGSRLLELSVLLRDAKQRLTLQLEVLKLNQTRRSLIETVYDDDGSMPSHIA